MTSTPGLRNGAPPARVQDGQPYVTYNVHNFRNIPQIGRLSEEQRFAIEVVAQVLPFKANNYVVEQLINWDNVPNDPIFTLTFPQRDMLIPEHFETMATLMLRMFCLVPS